VFHVSQYETSFGKIHIQFSWTLLRLSHRTNSLKHSWAYQPHHSWVKINILETSAVPFIRVSVVRTSWSEPTTELTKPYLHTEAIAGLVIRKRYNCNWDCTYANRYFVLVEGLEVVRLRTCAASGNIAFWGEQNLVGWLSEAWIQGGKTVHPVCARAVAWADGIVARVGHHCGEGSVTRGDVGHTPSLNCTLAFVL
jgi:hypothetical protein